MCKCVAIILSGGTGTRFGDENTPKQYYKLGGIPIISRVLRTYEQSEYIDGIVVVADSFFYDFILSEIKTYKISKFISFAKPGGSRTESMYHGFKKITPIMQDYDYVIIQDAARPFITSDMIARVFLASNKTDCDGAVISYDETEGYGLSKDGKYLTDFLNVKMICIQSPDCYRWGKYSKIIFSSSSIELAASRGCQSIAINHNLKVKLVGGGGRYNPKITTKEDLLFCNELLLSHFKSL